MNDWPLRVYPGMAANPYSIISRDGDRLHFATCMETKEEAMATAEWLARMNAGRAVRRCVYERGRPIKEVGG